MAPLALVALHIAASGALPQAENEWRPWRWLLCTSRLLGPLPQAKDEWRLWRWLLCTSQLVGRCPRLKRNGPFAPVSLPLPSFWGFPQAKDEWRLWRWLL